VDYNVYYWRNSSEQRHSSVCGKADVVKENVPISVLHESKVGDCKRRGYRSYSERQIVGLFHSLKFRFGALNDDGRVGELVRFPGFARSSFFWGLCGK